jgi:hypothetical protein
VGQLQALVGLRWRMIRSARVRFSLKLFAAMLPATLLIAVLVGQAVPRGAHAFDVLLLAPTLYVVVAVLAVVAPLVAGGGNELYPEGQLVAYPIRPRTVFTASLLMAPLNLAWLTQLVALTGATAVIAERGPRVVLSVVTALVYVALVTVLGQSLAWGVVGLRQKESGRRAVRLAAAATGMAALVLVASGSTSRLLDASPTTGVVIAGIHGSQGRYLTWAITTALLCGLTVLSARVGSALCAWALRSASPLGRPELRPVLRRGPRRTMLAELVAVLGLLPAIVAAAAHPSWASLALLPGLVAAGAGLLFGVNAFCLDGAGAVFVASLPHSPRASLLAKLTVVGQTCLLTVLIAVGVAATQVGRAPSGAEALALAGSVMGCTLLVVASCARLSVLRPHKADLRGPRDTPAPPVTMAVYSLRLALVTTWPGLLFAGAGASGSSRIALTVLVLVVAVAVRSLLVTMRIWNGADRRSLVVNTVAYG